MLSLKQNRAVHSREFSSWIVHPDAALPDNPNVRVQHSASAPGLSQTRADRESRMERLLSILRETGAILARSGHAIRTLFSCKRPFSKTPRALLPSKKSNTLSNLRKSKTGKKITILLLHYYIITLLDTTIDFFFYFIFSSSFIFLVQISKHAIYSPRAEFSFVTATLKPAVVTQEITTCYVKMDL